MGKGPYQGSGGLIVMDKGTPASSNRTLSVMDVWAMAFGCMVGWGAFVMPGTTFLPVAGPCGTVIAIFLGMVLMLVIGNNFAYLMKRVPFSGGVYSYTKEAFGRDHAFISSWFLCLSYLTIVFLNGTALFVVLRTVFGDLSQRLSYYVSSVAILALIGIMFIQVRSVLQKIHTILGVILLTGVIITAIVCLPGVMRNGALRDFGFLNISRPYGIFSIVFLAPWAFVGFDVIAFETGHFKFDVGKSRKIIFTSIILAAAAYIAMAIVAVSAVPDGYASWQEYITDISELSGTLSVPTFYAAESIMGSKGVILLSITAFAAILTGIIGGYRATTQTLSAMAEDRILSGHFSKTSNSIIFVMVISIVLALFGKNTLNWFVDLTSFGAITGFGYSSAAAFKLARTENRRDIEVTGLVGLIVSGLFIIVQLVPRMTAMEAMGSEAFLLLSVWCLLGFIFYWRTINRSSLTEQSGMSKSGIVLFTLIIYSAIMWYAKYIITAEGKTYISKKITVCSIILMIIVFSGLVIMLYVQNLVRKKHEASERDKIRAVESSLAKSRFLFNMSHDIRTPMNAIIGYTELALKEPAEPKLHDYLEKIDLSNKHLLSLINDILEMSRIENGMIELELAPENLYKAFDEIRDLFSEQMKQKKLDYTVHSSKINNCYVWIDKENLTRVLVNLIGNAMKFTPEGGSVSVSIGQMGSVGEGYGSYEIRVSDTGIGMSKEFVEVMFNPFEREHTSTVSGLTGTGLGLSITKNIIDLMGGTIDVLTSPGSGTEFIIRLKFKIAQDAEYLAAKELSDDSGQGEQYDFSGKRVLVVEDIEINMEIAETILKNNGFEVEKAENGQIAVNMVADSAPGYYDAILMDIQMPVMDGYEATRKIRQLSDTDLSKIPIIAMTANAFKEDKDAAIEAGMQAHIAKPIDVKILLNTLAELIA